MTVINSNIITEVANMGAGGTACALAFNTINDTFTALGVGDSSDADVTFASVTTTGDVQGATVTATTSVTASSLLLSHATLVTATFTTGATAGFTFAVTDTLAALGVTGATGEAEFRIPDNLADAFSIRILSGNDMLVFQTTNNAEAVLIANNLASTPPANQTLTNDATITLPTGCVKVVDNGGAVTGIILTAGVVDGQILHIVNAAAATVTFAASGTSNVADGTSAVIAANRAISLIWDSGTSLWYRTG